MTTGLTTAAQRHREERTRRRVRRTSSLCLCASVVILLLALYPAQAVPILALVVAIAAGQAAVWLLRGRAVPPAREIPAAPPWMVLNHVRSLVYSGWRTEAALLQTTLPGLEREAAVAALANAIYAGESLVAPMDLIRTYDAWASLAARVNTLDRAIASTGAAPELVAALPRGSILIGAAG